jgi:uroporphyrinogen decarboxylase
VRRERILASVPAPIRNDRFLRACRRAPVDRTPVWYMRQAGRYLPEYRRLRGDRDVLASCREPEIAVEATLQPLRRMDVDAAILFSDIMVPLAGLGIDVRVEAGIGPVVAEPVRSREAVRRLRRLEPESDVPYVLEAVRLLRRELDVPLIGFAGAPFTLACYLVDGGASRVHARTRALMLADEHTWTALMEALGDIVLAHLRAQAAAGADALQIFDSWVGVLAPADYDRFVLPHMAALFARLSDLDVPMIHFGVGTGELLSRMRRAGGDVIGVDWRVPLDEAWDRIGTDAAIQGNLDPVACLAPWEVVHASALDVLRLAAGRPGHIFNLGHGVLPSTPPDTLARLTDLVHELGAPGEAFPASDAAAGSPGVAARAPRR